MFFTTGKLLYEKNKTNLSENKLANPWDNMWPICGFKGNGKQALAHPWLILCYLTIQSSASFAGRWSSIAAFSCALYEKKSAQANEFESLSPSSRIWEFKSQLQRWHPYLPTIWGSYYQTIPHPWSHGKGKHSLLENWYTLFFEKHYTFLKTHMPGKIMYLNLMAWTGHPKEGR